MEWICTECNFETDSDNEADRHAENYSHDVWPKEDYYIEKYYTNKKPEAASSIETEVVAYGDGLAFNLPGKAIGNNEGLLIHGAGLKAGDKVVLRYEIVDEPKVEKDPRKTPFRAGKFTAGWTGAYPNLCSGKWIIVVDHRPFILPHDRQRKPMGTFGVYSTWYFDEESCEQFEDYESGLEFPEWLAKNSEWLLTAFDANNVEKTWANAQDFYNAVSNNDWRHNSCGGCI